MAVLHRRHMLALLSGAAAAGMSMPAFAAGTEDRKFIFVVLRGGLDGLAALVPTDPQLKVLRPSLHSIADTGKPITSAFTLHPALSGIGGLYADGEAAFVPATATAYRERSHFDGQDLLETLSSPGARIGWLNRLAEQTSRQGLGVGYALPLALQGPGQTTNWAPAAFEPASTDLLDRLGGLYAIDAELGAVLRQARGMSATSVDIGPGPARGDAALAEQSFRAIGKLMTAPGGPGIGMISLDGWDTHANQAGALNNRLELLDTAVLALREEMASDWKKTCLVLCSEFGRTAIENGTRGTDHGTGGLVILAGGAVKGGRVYGDWPGLKQRDLRDNRDLAPANAIEDVLAGLIRDHMGADWKRVLPGARQPFNSLIRT